MTAGAAATTVVRPRGDRLGDLLRLGKPRIVFLSVLQAAMGLWLASGPGGPVLLGATLVGTALLVAAANSLNEYLERDTDRLMARTADRPLPAGRLTPGLALAWGVGIGGAGTLLLAVAVNLLTAGLGLLALVTYVLAYTPLKRRTSLALVVGAIPGAMPPLMGWTARAGELSAPGLALFAVLFVWQIPHFLAIASYLQRDYARAGIRVVPLIHGERVSRAWAVAAATALVPASLLLTFLGVAGVTYAVIAFALGLAFVVYGALGLRRTASVAWARRYFLASLLYLPALTAALLVDGLVR